MYLKANGGVFMDWKRFWKVVRIGFGSVILLAGVVMLISALFVDGVDVAYAMFALLTVLLGLIMLIFGVSTLPKKP